MKRIFYSTKRYLALTLVFVALPFLLGACQGEEKPTITFADTEGAFGTMPLEGAVAGFIIENLYGYPTDVVQMSTPTYQATLPTGELHVQTEGWEQNIMDWYTEEIDKGRIENLGPMLEGGPQMWVIPQYTHEEHGIETVQDLADPEVAQLFQDPEDPSKGVFYNCIIGWACEKLNTVKMEAYGLDEYYNIVAPGSAGALKGQLAAAQKKEEPVFGYYWSPTALMGQYDWYILKEPENTESCWDKVNKAAFEDESLRPLDEACAYPNPPLNKLVWSGLQDEAPEAYDFMKKMQMDLDSAESTMAWASGEEIKDITETRVVAHYIRTYPDIVKSWLTDDEWDKVNGAVEEAGF